MSKVYRQPTLVASPNEADPLEAIARQAAQQMIQAALEHEVEEYLVRQRYRRTSTEQPFRGYRNGRGRERKLSLGSGTIKVRAPRVRDIPPEQQPFESQIIEPYQKRSRTVAQLFPKLFIEGLATRDFEPSLRCLLGEDAALSPSTISRLNQKFRAEYEEWQKRDLSAHRFVYIYADGVYMKAGLGHERAAVLVIYGVDADGRKHLVALEEGIRESGESWTDLLRSLRDRGMHVPVLAVADGALGFWSALDRIWPQARRQRCWFHKASNILAKLPQSERKEAAKRLRAVYMAESRAVAERLAGQLAGEWQRQYVKAAECLLADLDECLEFYNYPREHWRHLRTTNPIESIFGTLRLRTNAAKRLRTVRSAVHLIHQVLNRYEGSLQRISAPEKLKEVLDRVDGPRGNAAARAEIKAQAA